MLGTKKVELELISDADMYLFYEKGMRGGASYFSKRHSKASNKYLKSYDTKKESKHTIYLTHIIYMVILCLNFFQQVALNG